MLHEYQKRMVAHVKDNSRAALFAEMGLGKTLACLEAIKDLPGPVLIVAPLRVVQHVWQQEAEKWGYEYTFSSLIGNVATRTRAAEAEADVYLINIDNLVWLRNRYADRWPWPTVIFDESSLLKTPGSKRTRAAIVISRRAENVVLLSGTPSPKSLLDLYSQIKILDGGKRLGRSMEAYKQSYFFPVDYMKYKWEVIPGCEETIQKQISDICLSLRTEDYLEMPDMMTNDVVISLPKQIKEKYDELAKKMYVEIKDEALDAPSAGALVNKLQQFTSGAAYTGFGDGFVQIHEAKTEALKDIIEEAAGQQVLVVYNYKHSYSRIKHAVKNIVELRDDDHTVASWNAGDIQIMALHPASGGHGLNLQGSGAHIIVWFDLTYNLDHYQQTNARLHRQGQTKPARWSSGIKRSDEDGAVINSLETKAAVQDVLMEALRDDKGSEGNADLPLPQAQRSVGQDEA